MKNVVIKKNSEIKLDKFKEFYLAYNQSFFLEDDKDSYIDFCKIIESGNKSCSFFLCFIEENKKIISGALIISVDNDSLVSKEIKKLCGVIYIFTLPEYRNKGNARCILDHIFLKFEKAIWFCEVLDCNKATVAQGQKEEKYSGLSCEERDAFWSKMKFYECLFDYYNPIPRLDLNCNGEIGYNKLMVKMEFDYLEKDLLLFFLYQYFAYGYCAGEIDDFKWEAYKKMEIQLERKIYLKNR